MADLAYGAGTMDAGIRSRFVDNGCGLRMHLLEAGADAPSRPLVVLLHGFPELAYSWRKVLPALAAAGYYAVAPDQRGYGATTGADARYDTDLRAFHMPALVRDVLGLLQALGRPSAAAVVGHDFGSPVAAWASVIRPDVFRSVVLMSAPFGGPPAIGGAPARASSGVYADLAALPEPRKHYQRYYSTPEADADMRHCPQGVHDFLRAYYHHKSGDWPGNAPYPLQAWTAGDLAQLPTYYVMGRDQTMPETVAAEMPSQSQIDACDWLTEPELAVYSDTFAQTGFQGGLNWYRAGGEPGLAVDLQLFAGRTIDVPSCFIGGASDWGVRQSPGAFERMQEQACTDMRGCHLVDGAGHWVQQEQPDETNRLLLAFLAEAMPGS